jgi:DNA-binding MarR family transcriptional regulator
MGHDDDRGPTISDLADYLLLKHHSAVELVNRCEKAGYVTRVKDGQDGRVVRVLLTEDGERRIRSLGELHIDELRRFAPALDHLVEGLEHDS